MVQQPPPLPAHVATLLELGRELRSLDYKRTMAWSDPATKAKLTKACLAMSNLADGGVVLIGVDEPSSGVFLASGMSPEDFDSFKSDDVLAEVNLFADPPINVTVHKGEVAGKLFVALEVAAFGELPTVSKRAGGPPGELITDGAFYIRPQGKPETRAVRNSQELRELLERAIDIGQARLQRRGWTHAAGSTPSAEDLARELGPFA